MAIVAMAPAARGRVGGQATLADLLDAVWAQIEAGGSAVCPLCHGELMPQYRSQQRQPGGAGAHGADRARARAEHGPWGGRCGRCGSELS